MTTTYTAENKQEVINEYITAVYAVKNSNWFEQTKERQELIKDLAGYILASYEAKTGGAKMNEKLTRADVFTERTYNGAWLCSAIYNGFREHRLYFGYSKREAVKMFIEDVTKG